MSSSFSLLVVTAATSHQSSSTLAELHLRQRKGLLPPSLRVLAVPDPLGQRVGSGGCVLNSLLEAARALWWDKERARKAQRWREPRSLAVGEGEEFGVEREKKERLMNTVRKNTETEGKNSIEISSCNDAVDGCEKIELVDRKKNWNYLLSLCPYDEFVSFECLHNALSSERILLFLSGGDAQRSPAQSVSGKAWASLNASYVVDCKIHNTSHLLHSNSPFSPTHQSPTHLPPGDPSPTPSCVDSAHRNCSTSALCPSCTEGISEEFPVAAFDLIFNTLAAKFPQLPLGSCLVTCSDVLFFQTSDPNILQNHREHRMPSHPVHETHDVRPVMCDNKSQTRMDGCDDDWLAGNFVVSDSGQASNQSHQEVATATIVGFAIETTKNYAQNHGVYLLDNYSSNHSLPAHSTDEQQETNGTSRNNSNLTISCKNPICSVKRYLQKPSMEELHNAYRRHYEHEQTTPADTTAVDTISARLPPFESPTGAPLEPPNPPYTSTPVPALQSQAVPAPRTPVNAPDSVAVDTGLVWLNTRSVKELLRLANGVVPFTYSTACGLTRLTDDIDKTGAMAVCEVAGSQMVNGNEFGAMRSPTAGAEGTTGKDSHRETRGVCREWGWEICEDMNIELLENAGLGDRWCVEDSAQAFRLELYSDLLLAAGRGGGVKNVVDFNGTRRGSETVTLERSCRQRECEVGAASDEEQLRSKSGRRDYEEYVNWDLKQIRVTLSDSGGTLCLSYRQPRNTRLAADPCNQEPSLHVPSDSSRNVASATCSNSSLSQQATPNHSRDITRPNLKHKLRETNTLLQELRVVRARQLLWQNVGNWNFKARLCEGMGYLHLGTTQELHQLLRWGSGAGPRLNIGRNSVCGYSAELESDESLGNVADTAKGRKPDLRDHAVRTFGLRGMVASFQRTSGELTDRSFLNGKGDSGSPVGIVGGVTCERESRRTKRPDANGISEAAESILANSLLVHGESELESVTMEKDSIVQNCVLEGPCTIRSGAWVIGLRSALCRQELGVVQEGVVVQEIGLRAREDTPLANGVLLEGVVDVHVEMEAGWRSVLVVFPVCQRIKHVWRNEVTLEKVMAGSYPTPLPTSPSIISAGVLDTTPATGTGTVPATTGVAVTVVSNSQPVTGRPRSNAPTGSSASAVDRPVDSCVTGEYCLYTFSWATGLGVEDIWGADVSEANRTFWNAKLFLQINTAWQSDTQLRVGLQKLAQPTRSEEANTVLRTALTATRLSPSYDGETGRVGPGLLEHYGLWLQHLPLISSIIRQLDPHFFTTPPAFCPCRRSQQPSWPPPQTVSDCHTMPHKCAVAKAALEKLGLDGTVAQWRLRQQGEGLAGSGRYSLQDLLREGDAVAEFSWSRDVLPELVRELKNDAHGSTQRLRYKRGLGNTSREEKSEGKNIDLENGRTAIGSVSVDSGDIDGAGEAAVNQDLDSSSSCETSFKNCGMLYCICMPVSSIRRFLLSDVSSSGLEQEESGLLLRVLRTCGMSDWSDIVDTAEAVMIGEVKKLVSMCHASCDCKTCMCTSPPQLDEQSMCRGAPRPIQRFSSSFRVSVVRRAAAHIEVALTVLCCRVRRGRCMSCLCHVSPIPEWTPWQRPVTDATFLQLRQGIHSLEALLEPSYCCLTAEHLRRSVRALCYYRKTIMTALALWQPGALCSRCVAMVSDELDPKTHIGPCRAMREDTVPCVSNGDRVSKNNEAETEADRGLRDGADVVVDWIDRFARVYVSFIKGLVRVQVFGLKSRIYFMDSKTKEEDSKDGSFHDDNENLGAQAGDGTVLRETTMPIRQALEEHISSDTQLSPCHNHHVPLRQPLLSATTAPLLPALAMPPLPHFSPLWSRSFLRTIPNPHCCGNSSNLIHRQETKTTHQLSDQHIEQVPHPCEALQPIVVVAEAPCRVDLAGGWSDLPLVSYETKRGGAVVNLAVRIGGRKPLAATAGTKWLSKQSITELWEKQTRDKGRLEVANEAHVGGGCDYRQEASDVYIEVAEKNLVEATNGVREQEVSLDVGDGKVTLLRCIHDIADVGDPTVDGALVKACMLALGVLRLQLAHSAQLPEEMPSSRSSGRCCTTSCRLSTQIRSDIPRNHNCLFVHTSSCLPIGSGMGSSSILAACVLEALATVLGRPFADRRSLVHAVLIVEQLMSTGGGWQDQVGGVFGGLMLGRCGGTREVQTCRRGDDDYLRSDRCCSLTADGGKQSSPNWGGSTGPCDVCSPPANAWLGLSGLGSFGMPNSVYETTLRLPTSLVRSMEGHLVLLETGKSRLAKTLVDGVMARWYVCPGDGGVAQLVHKLTTDAEQLYDELCEFAKQFEILEGESGDGDGDGEDSELALKTMTSLERQTPDGTDSAAAKEVAMKSLEALFLCRLGRAVSTNFELKKLMAPNSEPPHVEKIRAALNPLAHGSALCGAGGGGVLVVVLRRQLEDIRQQIRKVLEDTGMEVAEVRRPSVLSPAREECSTNNMLSYQDMLPEQSSGPACDSRLDQAEIYRSRTRVVICDLEIDHDGIVVRKKLSPSTS
eukprot:GHVQ01028382.1.p1 GENE.GHVQ01028382.1~~GHVQ01028382.1.p1  ORF type:complete len:2514 (+),score=307.44 GHVQ01028382.1:223-7764(+)